MGDFAGVLLGVVGLLLLIAAFIGGGWAIWQRARVSGRKTYLFLGGAMMAIGAYAVVAGVVAGVRMISS